MTYSRQEQKLRLQARNQERSRKASSFLLIGLIAVIALVGVIWISSASASAPVDHTVVYDPSLVVKEQPLHAVHEMTGPTLSSIQFLPEGGPQPKIVIEQTFFDFKQVGATEVVQHQFVIKNEGAAPLTISRAYTSCECTTGDFTATVIPPGKIAIMTLTFDAGFHDVRGQTVRRGVIIESNDPASPQTEIWTQAEVRTTP